MASADHTPKYLFVSNPVALSRTVFERVVAEVDGDNETLPPVLVLQNDHRVDLSSLLPRPGTHVTLLEVLEDVVATAEDPATVAWASAVAGQRQVDASAKEDATTTSTTTNARINIAAWLFNIDVPSPGNGDDAKSSSTGDGGGKKQDDKQPAPVPLPCALRGPLPEGAFLSTLPPKQVPYGALNISGVAAQLKRAKKVLVMCGAGISVAAGIPDFRTPGIGLYSNLDKYNLPEPEDLFTLEFLEEDPALFFRISNEMKLWPGTFAPTHAHHFVKLLADRGQLLRCYTQNIDGLERAAGLDPELLVEAHGSYAGATCMQAKCRKAYPLEHVRSIAQRGDVPRCDDCGSVIKPDVVFFGEQLPARFHRLLQKDVQEADMLLVMGTSLVVYPFAGIVELVRDSIPRVLLNMSVAGKFDLAPSPRNVQRDLAVCGDCQASVQTIAGQLGSGESLAERHKRGVESIGQTTATASESRL